MAILKYILLKGFILILFKMTVPSILPFIGVVFPLVLMTVEQNAAALVLLFNGEGAAGASSSNAGGPTEAPAERGTDPIVVGEPQIPRVVPRVELDAPIELRPGTEEMQNISLWTKRVHQVYSQYGSYKISTLQEPYFFESMDQNLLEAQRRGPIDFSICLDEANLALDCIEREGVLHHRLFGLISSESSLPSFFYKTPEDLRESIAITCDDSQFRPTLSLEGKLALRQDLSGLLASLQRQGREAPIYVEASHLAKTGDLPPPRGA
jgi:hypothetical protein